MSASVAVLVMVKLVSSLIVTFVWAGSTGAVLSSLTTTVNELVALRFWALTASGLESVTMVVKMLVLGPWASVGVQVMMPLAEMLAFVTTPKSLLTIRVYVSGLAGMSESVAVLVTVKVVSSAMV